MTFFCINIYFPDIFQFLYFNHSVWFCFQIRSDQISRSVVPNSLGPHESQYARPPCPSPAPGVHPNSCPSSWWCHPASHPLWSPSPAPIQFKCPLLMEALPTSSMWIPLGILSQSCVPHELRKLSVYICYLFAICISHYTIKCKRAGSYSLYSLMHTQSPAHLLDLKHSMC